MGLGFCCASHLLMPRPSSNRIRWRPTRQSQSIKRNPLTPRALSNAEVAEVSCLLCVLCTLRFSALSALNPLTSVKLRDTLIKICYKYTGNAVYFVPITLPTDRASNDAWLSVETFSLF